MPITDALFLLAEAREKPLHVGGLHLYRPAADAHPDLVGQLYRDAIVHEEVQPKLRRRPVRGLRGVGPWRWEEDVNLDLEYHVRHSALPHPGRIRELLALVSRLHGTLLDRNRALWEAHLIEGLDDGRFAVYTKIHHALVDGVSAMRLLERGLTDDPDVTDLPPPWAPQRRPAGGRRTGQGDGDGDGPLPQRLIGGAVRGVNEGVRAVTGAGEAALRSVVRAFSDQAAMLPYRAPRSSLNVPITGARRFAADSWSLDRIKAVATAAGGTVNDVVMAMSAGALRRYLVDQDALPDDPLVAMVPVSLHAGDDDTSNAVGLVLCNLGTNVADPSERFELIRASMHQGKLQLEGLNQWGVLLLSGLSFGGLAAAPLYRFESMRRPPFNIIISNVPGPRVPLYWNGNALEEMYPVSIPYDGQALNITVTSYVDELGFGLIGCRRNVPHLQRLLDHLDTSLLELEKAAGT